MATIDEINAAIEARKQTLAQSIAVPLQPQNQGQDRPMQLTEINSRILMRQKIARDKLAQPKAEQLQPEQEDQSFLADSASGVGRQILGGAEAAGTVLQNTLVDVIGGFGALAGGLDPTADKGTAVANLNKVRDLLAYDPRTPEAQEILKTLGQYLQPISEPLDAARQSLNDETLRRTGSPVAAGVASALPDLALEIAGLGQGRRGAQAAARATDTAQAKRSAQAEVNALEADSGVPLMTSDVFEPKTRLTKFMQQTGELLTGGKRNAQQERRVKNVETLINRYDVEDGANYEARIVDSVKNTIAGKKSQFGEMYANSSKQLDNFGDVQLTNIKDWAQSEISKQIRLGTQGDVQKIDDLKALLDAPDDLTFELVKEIRSGVGNKLAKAKQGAPVQGSSDVGFQSQIYKQLSKDMRAFADNASPSLATEWKAADKEFSAFAMGANKNGAKQLIKNGDATPEVVNTLLFSNKNSDIQFLADNLDASGLKASKQSIIQRMTGKATNADGDISANGFLKQIDDNRNRIGKIFTKDEARGIFALKDALSKTRRAQDAAVTTPTGQQLVPLTLIIEPIAITPAAIQYLIETPVARNLLIKRKAAKTAKERQVIGAELEGIMREQGLIGAAATGAATTQTQEDRN